MAAYEMSNRDRWLQAAYSFQDGQRIGKAVLESETTIWRRVNAWMATQCIMLYVAAFPGGPPDATE